LLPFFELFLFQFSFWLQGWNPNWSFGFGIRRDKRKVGFHPIIILAHFAFRITLHANFHRQFAYKGDLATQMLVNVNAGLARQPNFIDVSRDNPQLRILKMGKGNVACQSFQVFQDFAKAYLALGIVIGFLQEFIRGKGIGNGCGGLGRDPMLLRIDSFGISLFFTSSSILKARFTLR
jgi:hypothetical protein